MDNRTVAAIFQEMADLLEVQGGDRYRARAFKRIANVVGNLAEPLEEAFHFGRLERVPGIGPGAVGRITEILRTGTCIDIERLRATLPTGLRELALVEGIGFRTARVLHQHLGITSVDELEVQARAGKIAGLPGLGARSEERILRGIELYRRQVGRVPLAQALATGMEIVEAMRAVTGVSAADLAGSARRGKDTATDLDVLVAADDPARASTHFIALPQMAEVKVRGDSRAAIRLESGQQVDLRVIPLESYGAALHYFTGSQQHNIYLRARANRRGLKVSEHGVFRRHDEVLLHSGRTEEEIFAAAGLPFIPPELRENLGELEAAAEGRLPHLITDDALRGELHARPTRVGDEAVAEMAAAALEMRLEYLALTAPAAAVATGVAWARSLRQLEQRLGRLRLLAGVEVEILPDGELAMERARLAELDWVVATVETELEMPAEAMTARIVRALESGLVDCLAHPTNRLLCQREPTPMDLDKVLKTARRLEVALEVSSHPLRLDLDAAGCRRARDLGVPVMISTDARGASELTVARRSLGLKTARRGWLERKDVLNAQPVEIVEERRRERLRHGGVAVAAPRRRGKPATVARPQTLADAVTGLAAELGQTPLSPVILGRLERYLEVGNDDVLEAALRQLGKNPLQLAFNLVFAPR